MKSCLFIRPAARRLLRLMLAASFALPLPALAAPVALATAPLATSTTSTVKPNLMFVFDDSGSMAWENMPDDAAQQGISSFSFGYYGLRSSQCNMVYYDPTHTYSPPVHADGTDYTNASFTSARTNGFDTSSSTVNLNTSFRAIQGTDSLTGDSSGQAAYYYNYSGTQTTPQDKKYNNDPTNTFSNECHSAQHDSPGWDVFTKISLSNSAAATTATIVVGGLIDIATLVSSIKVNRTQEIMSDATLIGLNHLIIANEIAAKINNCTNAKVGNCTTVGGHHYAATVETSLLSSTVRITGLADTASTLTITKTGVTELAPTIRISPTIFPKANAANLTNFANWYSYYRKRILMMKTAAGRAFSGLNEGYRVGLMNITNSSPPAVAMGDFASTQRSNWYSTLYGFGPQAGTPLREALSNAGRYYAGQLSGTDPVQYSCQQNFAILSTDGYWNSAAGFQLDGSTAVGNQDGEAVRPMYDGAHAFSIWTRTYTRNYYSRVRTDCARNYFRLRTQPQIGSCTVTVSGASCVPASWTNNGPAEISGTCIRNRVTPPPSTPVEQPDSPVESTGTSGGSSDSLADVAMYYYQTDLRPGDCTLCTDNVFISETDNNIKQHMTTFTLGLGASGKMNYSSSYLNDSSGDYVAVKLGSTASSTVCPWQAVGTVCNWPIPGSNQVENIDDLWHAAVDGRGAYYSATSPASLSAGLADALAGIQARRGAGAAAATSTLNPVAGDNFAYVASYTTVSWKGNLEARGINTDTGVVSENATWCAENVAAGTCASPGTIIADTSGDTTAYNCVTTGRTTCPGGVMDPDGSTCRVPVAATCTGTMNAKVSAVSDTRVIKTANSTGTALVNFDAAFTSAATANISGLSQWTSPGYDQAASRSNLIGFLRGQNGYEDRTANVDAGRPILYRAREAVLGDALESQPAFLGKPVFNYTYPGYSDFKTAQAGRAGTVYLGTNDGMMHAFNADTGDERWAYVPSMVIPDLWKLADTSYRNLHTNYVNGSAVTSDICTASAAICNTTAASADWRSILVGGLNGGGRGYYALDITNPASPALLWEFTTTAGAGKIKDADLGYSFGQPVIARKKDGTWVVLVTSGYNNTSPGDGQGYLYVLNAYTGAIISKITTGVGGSSGLARIAAWNDDPAGTAGYVYGGDLEGNLWRFDINSTAPAVIGTGAVMKFATLFSASGVAQPVTTTPVLGKIAGKRVVFTGTGKYLEASDITNTQRQSLYAIKDDNATVTLVNPRNTLVQQTITTSGSTRTVSAAAVNWNTGRGWFADLPDGGTGGAGTERVNIDGKLVLGALLAPTIVPAATACEPGGHGWLNFFNYQNGGVINTQTTITSVKYDAPIVGINILNIAGQPKVEVVTANNPTPVIEQNINISPQPGGFKKKRMLWRELIR